MNLDKLSNAELLELEVKLQKQISTYNNQQMAYKIALNSLYGASASPYFRYFDLQLARAITLTGQYIIQSVDRGINRNLNKSMKTDDYVYCFYCDTDSVYIKLEPIIEKYCKGKSVTEIVAIMDDFCEKQLRPMITKICTDLQDYIGAYRNSISFKREVIADKGIWTAKKRYILNVHNSEGVQYEKPKLKIMGLEMVKSSTPAVVRKKLKESLDVILNHTEQDLHEFVRKYHEEFRSLPVEEIAFPRSVNGLKQYGSSTDIYSKGTPIHVRGTLMYNHLLKKHKLDNKYPLIKEGEKIKFVYLIEPNTIQEDIISFLNTLPKEFSLHKYINYDKQFEKVFLDPLSIVLEPIGWSVEEKTSLEDFFG